MENYKVRVENEAESKEAQELFEVLGYEKGICSIGGYPAIIVTTKSWGTGNYCSTRAIGLNNSAHDSHKELTLPELRDLVVLKRNDVNDATHACESMHHRRGYLSSDGIEYIWFYGQNEWFKAEKSFNEHGLKPIEKTMKEYLNEKCELITAPESEAKEPHAKGWIEIPEGAEVATICQNYIIFWKDEKYSFSISEENKWCYKSCDDSRYFSLGEYMNEYSDASVIWQRNAPAVSDEVNKSSKLKSVSETLKERQQQYGCFEDVAMVTRRIMDAIEWARGKDKLPEPHYEALHMIASKIARIVNGNCNSIDEWHDIGGYAKLIENLIGEDEDDMPF